MGSGGMRGGMYGRRDGRSIGGFDDGYGDSYGGYGGGYGRGRERSYDSYDDYDDYDDLDNRRYSSRRGERRRQGLDQWGNLIGGAARRSYDNVRDSMRGRDE